MDIAIASGKGGTGKTTLAVNFASFLQNIVNLRNEVVLVDLDVEEPNAGLFLKGKLVNKEKKFRPVPVWIGDNCSLCGKCRKICQFNAIAQLPQTLLIYPELCHSCYACSELCPEQALRMTDREIGILKHYRIKDNSYSGIGFSFIESTLNIGEPSAVSLIQQTKEYTNNLFSGSSFNILDCPPGTSCPVIESTKDADFVILVTEPTPFGLHDLKLAVDTMRKLDREFGVVINRYDTGNDIVLQYCEKENIQILAKIPNDRKIAEQYARGELIYPGFPEVEKQLGHILKHILRFTKFNIPFTKNINRKNQINRVIESYKNSHNYI